MYVKGDWKVMSNPNTGRWCIRQGERAHYRTKVQAEVPPTEGWEVNDDGLAPVPSVLFCEAPVLLTSQAIP